MAIRIYCIMKFLLLYDLQDQSFHIQYTTTGRHFPEGFFCGFFVTGVYSKSSGCPPPRAIVRFLALEVQGFMTMGAAVESHGLKNP
jgi:hypothetical protein